MPFIRFLPFLLLFYKVSFSQSIPTADYTEVDSLARTVTYNNNLKLLVNDLTKGYDTQLLKARAIFAWIADNIAYDYKMYNRNKRNPFKCRKGQNCKEEYIKWENKLIGKTLSKEIAICEGYARLFKRMCEYAGISVEVVSGYIKNEKSQIGRMGILDHAWNGIYIDGEYYYLDVTWAAGVCSKDEKGRLDGFHKYFNDYYWLTPADKFLRDHFPKDETLPHIMVDSKQKYKDSPYINPGFIHDVNVICPDSGIITASVGDTIQFDIEHKNMAWNTINVYSNLDRFQKSETLVESGGEASQPNKVPHTRTGFIYSFKYVITDKKIRYVDVYFNNFLHIVRIKVNVVED